MDGGEEEGVEFELISDKDEADNGDEEGEDDGDDDDDDSDGKVASVQYEPSDSPSL